MASPLRKVARWLAWGVLALGGAAALSVWLVACVLLSGPGYEGPKSEHFDGKRFQNYEKHDERSLIRWLFTRERGQWNRIAREPMPEPPDRVDVGTHIVAFINHATMLIQKDGVNLLTDPVYSERTSPFSWVGPRRHRQPGLLFEELPPIDAVLISHNHYDALDLPTLARLQAKNPQMRIFVPLGNAPLLTDEGLQHVTELDWWQSADLGKGVKVHAAPAQHFSGRGWCDRDRTLWASWMITAPSGSTYFAGDTGKGPHFKLIRERLGSPRVALLPIGAYKPQWFMSPVHISPAEAVDAAEQLGAAVSIPMHYGTFPLGDDGQTEPLDELRAALKARGPDGPKFLILAQGEGRRIEARVTE